MPKVSVCIPTYNRKDYLKETIESILSQGYTDYEIVILDDGSTDGTGEMLAESDYPVRYHRQENSGDASARNKLIELARGEYIAFFDSDDLMIPDALERMVAAQENEPDDVVVYGSYIGIDEDGNVIRKSKRRLYSGHITEQLFQDTFLHPTGSLLPKRMLEGENGFDVSLPVCSDYKMWLALSLKYRFISLDEPVFKRRRHASNLSGYTYENRLVELNVFEDFYFTKGGKENIDKSSACRRLAKQAYRAGKCAMQENLYPIARDLLKKSLGYHFNIKTAWLFMKLAFLDKSSQDNV